MVDSGLQAALLVVSVLFLVVVCVLFQRRPRPEAFSHEELNQIRIDRERAKEAMLEEKAQRLKGRARVHRHNRMVLTARRDTGRLLQGAQERWDARGRSIYGDAWDDPQDGNIPLRTLFNLPREEIDSIREEAYNLLRASPGSDFSSLPLPPGRPPHFDDSGTQDCVDVGLRKPGVGNNEHRAMTASARRGPAYSRHLSEAPFVDERFVHVTTPVVPPLDLTRLSDASIAQSAKRFPRPPSTAAQGRKLRSHDTSTSPPVINPLRMNLASTSREEHNRPTDPATKTDIARDHTNLERIQLTKQMAAAPLSSFQDPGLIHPKPPDVPFPRSMRDNHGMEPKHESLSARLARLAAGGNSRRVVPIELV